jgi:hypothetical protein
MDSQHPTPSAVPSPVRGLPPVTPPSGRFIAQLFLVPGTIVLVAVLLLLAFRYLLGGGYLPESFLKQLDNENTDIRWRGASDLAQVLKRPESMNLKSDPAFALELAQRLRAGLDDLAEEETRIQEKNATASPAEKEASWGKPLDAKRNYVNFLAATMGDFLVPVGVPLLCEILLRDDSPDPKSILRRRQALNSLISLGDNLKGFHKLPAPQQAEIRGLLVKESGSTNPTRAACARNGLYYVDNEQRSVAAAEGIVKVDNTLAKVAEDPDQFLRELVAFAFNFWDGPLAEPTLLNLTRDRGQGTLVRVPE